MNFSVEAECGYALRKSRRRELQWSMSWLRPGGKLENAYPKLIIQFWDFILVINKTPGYVTTCQADIQINIKKGGKLVWQKQ